MKGVILKKVLQVASTLYSAIGPKPLPRVRFSDCWAEGLLLNSSHVRPRCVLLGAQQPPVFHNTRLEISMKKRILAAILVVLALTACAPTQPTPSEEARRCLTDSLNLVPRDEIRRAGATSYEGGVTRGYVETHTKTPWRPTQKPRVGYLL